MKYFEIKNSQYPIVIENNYLLKSEITSRILPLFLFVFLLYILLEIKIPRAISENDLLDLRMYQAGVITVVLGILWVLFGNSKMFLGLIRKKLYIKIYEDVIDYEYIVHNGEKRTYQLQNDRIKQVTWSWFPIFGEINKIETPDTSLNTKLEKLISYPFKFIFNIAFLFIYYLLQLFRLKKYYILNDEEVLLSLPKNSIYKLKNNVSFSKLTLEHSLIIKNSTLLKG